MSGQPNTRGSNPGETAAAVTPSDSVNLTADARSLYIGGAGNASVVTANGDTVTFVGLLAGSILPVRIRRVNATDTTATNIVAIY